ncbi:MAG TPA: hypothetical protein VJB96_00100, partial [Patescibacteria group bacterium]|nr:hypothetical protein [Patescibacteria group bacterium]
LLTGMYRVNIVVAKVIHKVTGASPGSLQWVNVQLPNAFLRLPAMLSDILIGYVIYLLVKKYGDKKRALLASALYLFNPAVFYNSSFWGQMDAINNALFMLALYAYDIRKQFLSILSLFLSLFVKLTLVIVIGPLMALWLWLERNKRQFVLFVALSVAVVLVLTLPLSTEPHIWFYQFLQKNSLGEMNNITSLAMNFWWVVFKPRIAIGNPTSDFDFTLDTFIGSPESTAVHVGLPLFTWALVITAVVCVPLVRVVWSLREKALKPKAVFLLLSLFSLVGYLFLPHMHERYLYPFFMLMPVSIALTKRYMWAYVLLSFLNFLNLYLVWHPMLRPALPYNIMNSADFQWLLSLATVVIGMAVYVKSLKFLRSVR